MFKRPARWVTTTALVVAGLTACDDGPGPTGVDVFPPSEDVSADLTGTAYDTNFARGADSYALRTGATLVSTESFEDGVVTVAIVGRRGGTITAGRHSLEIPRNAVLEDTEFRMEVLSGSTILVDLSARSVGSGEAVSAFPDELTLTLSYRNVLSSSDAKRLRNVYLHEDSPDQLVRLPSRLDKKNKTISSPIEHFSIYGMAIE